MEYFFYYQDDLPADVGFTYFSPAHIFWLLLTVLASAGIAVLFRRVNDRTRKKISLLIGWVIAATYVIRELFILLTGHMSVYELPFHLCIITGYLCLAHAYTDNRLIGHFLYSGGIPGTLMALITPDWTVYPPFSFISITNFVYHGLILVYAAGQLSGGRLSISLKKTWQVFLLVCAMAAPVYVIDILLQVNYMFLMIPSPGSVLSFISNITGDNLYLVGFAVFNMAVLVIMDGIYSLVRRIILRHSSPQEKL